MLTDQQNVVKKSIMNIIRQKGLGMPRSLHSQLSFVTTIGGYAGTGKTFLIGEIRNEIKKQYPRSRVAFCTFTGKASSVLSQKLETVDAIGTNDYVGTIHRLIYKPKTRYDMKLKAHVIVGWKLIDFDDLIFDLIIIDEASMVSKEIWESLRSFDIPIIAVGDHGQLGPVGDYSFNLMQNPDHKLTEIHRQAQDSPIIKLSQMAREDGQIPFNTIFSRNPAVLKVPWYSSTCQKIWDNIQFDSDTMCICGFNVTRNYINNLIRKRLGYEKTAPYPGERVVCLKNNRDLGIMNGQTGTVYFMMPEKYKNTFRLTLQPDSAPEFIEAFTDGNTFDQVTYTMYGADEDREKKLIRYSRGHDLGGVNYFDYGYCISVHKSQGSEWDRIILFEQRNRYQDDEQFARWLYTAITRAKTKLLIISDFNF
jgi:ATP-dependent exoDNAse (exonuclease V) alpha subunit